MTEMSHPIFFLFIDLYFKSCFCCKFNLLNSNVATAMYATLPAVPSCITLFFTSKPCLQSPLRLDLFFSETESCYPNLTRQNTFFVFDKQSLKTITDN